MARFLTYNLRTVTCRLHGLTTPGEKAHRFGGGTRVEVSGTPNGRNSMNSEDRERFSPPNSSAGLKKLMAMGLGVSEPWQPEDLKLALEEQLAVPIEVELSGLEQQISHRLRLRAKREGLLLRSLGDLFQHPRPPVELLILVKDFFKRNRGHPKSDLPPDVCLALYYLCIAVALWRHRVRISQLNDSELAEAFRWMQAHDWIGGTGREAAVEAARALAR